LVSPFRYIRAAYAPTPLISEANLPAAGFERLDLQIDGNLRLLGFRVGRAGVQPGQWLPVTLYWQTPQPVSKNYSVFVHALGRDNAVVGQSNSYPDQGNRPTVMLEPGPVLPDTHYVWISPQAQAPAVLRLAMGLFEFTDPARTAKPAQNAAGKTVTSLVGAVPLTPRAWPTLAPAHPLTATFAGQIKLVGFDWPAPAAVKPGQTLPLTLYWDTQAPPGQPLNLFIHLVNPATGSQLAGFDGPPDFPTNFWQTGNPIVDHRQLTLPNTLPPGTYELRVGWYHLNNFARLPLTDRPGDSVTLLTMAVE
jgi:hypothetical protein